MENRSQNVEVVKEISPINNNDKRKMKKRSKSSVIFRRFICLRSVGDYSMDDAGSFEVEALGHRKDQAPSHLIVMVNGIIGSAQNWRYAAKQFVKAYPNDVIVHCSDANSNMLTFDGVDVMGKRLADEVVSVIRRHPNLQKISFIGHSLGGLVARYAIALLYEKEDSNEISEENGVTKEVSEGKIAGLRPVNYISSASPHLGSRGHKQVPLLCGSYKLEKVASSTSWLLGRTGKHLFLADRDNGKPPLLLQMANDSKDVKFISALRLFSRRVAYANASFDQIVGWSTSSMRRRSELPKRHHFSGNDKYPHIMSIEKIEASSIQDDVSVDAKLDAGKDMEEAMIRGLTRVSWERVDVNFKGSKQRYLAHSTIQVKTKYLNSDGADVIQHMVDSFLL